VIAARPRVRLSIISQTHATGPRSRERSALPRDCDVVRQLELRVRVLRAFGAQRRSAREAGGGGTGQRVASAPLPVAERLRREEMGNSCGVLLNRRPATRIAFAPSRGSAQGEEAE
jgi:hypothetical protein